MSRRAAASLSPLGEAGVALASQGWGVFQLFPLTKVPLKGSRGIYDATTDPLRVLRMWQRCPDANVALVTGRGFIVVDLDDDEALLRLCAAGVDLPATVRAKTPRGQHWYYEAPREIRCTTALLPGVDIRGLGGYVVAPPSAVFPCDGKPGGNYDWIVPLRRSSIAPAPESLLNLLLAPRQLRPSRVLPFAEQQRRPLMSPSVDPMQLLVEGAAQGARNVSLFKACCALRREGASEQTLRNYAEAVNLVMRPPLPRRELLSIVRSAARYAPASVADEPSEGAL